LVAAVAVIAFRLTISPAVERSLEMAVGFLLIALGLDVIRRSARQIRVHRHEHTHGDGAHAHLHVHARLGPDRHHHWHLLAAGRRPFMVGLLHGMAGSAALMLLVLATIPSAASALLYVLVFGIGSTAGMLCLSGLIGVPFL